MPAYWTEDGSDKVVKQHFQPEQVDTSTADVVTNKRPTQPDVKPWVETTLCYNDKRGLYYKTENPFSGLNLTQPEKEAVFQAVMEQNLVEARNIIEKALKK